MGSSQFQPSSSAFLRRINAVPRRFVVILAIITVGVATLLLTKAATPSSDIQAESGTRTAKAGIITDPSASGGSAIRFGNTTGCGKQVQNYSYEVPFGNAVWNQPICGLPRHPQSADYASRLWEWSYLNDGTPEFDLYNGKIGVNPGFPKTPTLQDPTGLGALYTTEVYFTSTATTIVDKSVTTVLYQSNLDGEKYNPTPSIPGPGLLSNNPTTKMPWSSSWKSAGGTDANIVVIDDRPGKEGAIYSVWGYNKGNCVLISGPVCAYRVSIGRGFDGSIIDYRTHEGYTKDRGVGLNPYATLTMADEVEAGEIRHALGVSLPNNMFGPDCTAAQLQSQNWNIIGKQCGTAVAPASKFEWKSETQLTIPEWASTYTREKTIPEGMRFGLDITYEQIEQWILSRPDFASDSRRADTARIFARALKDYGMMVVDSNSSKTTVQTEGGVNPISAAKWSDLHMGPSYKDDLLDGLITESNMFVVNPPQLTCRDGSISRFYCEWSGASY